MAGVEGHWPCLPCQPGPEGAVAMSRIGQFVLFDAKILRTVGETLLRIWYVLIRQADQLVASHSNGCAFRIMDPMNRRDLLLAVLACAEGRSFTLAQVQKAMFL